MDKEVFICYSRYLLGHIIISINIPDTILLFM